MSAIKAPQENGALLAVPSLADVGSLLGERDFSSIVILGRPLEDLRRVARRETVNAAVEYLQSVGEPLPSLDNSRLFLAGHQPELFHPGVWIKNFALHGLARRHDAVPVNLVVDNDLAKAPFLRVPEDAHLVRVAFDQPNGDVPYEERDVEDESLFASFAARIAERTKGWPFTPLLPDFWAKVLKQAHRTKQFGERFAAARRELEREWGCHNLEVPLSRLCQTETFAWFASHLVLHAERFQQIYNRALAEFRERQGIRSKNHPAPDLETRGEWIEVPLWAWTKDQPQRRRLFVRREKDSLQFARGMEPWQEKLSVAALPDAWQQLENSGLKVRTRALTTTLFSRLFIADLFLHGIGGGIYDAVTDAIAQEFYGSPLGPLMILSGTLHLPFPHKNTKDVRIMARELRDLHYNPQRHLHKPISATVDKLIADKQAWIARPAQTPQQKQERFQKLREVNEELRPFLGEVELNLHRELTEQQELHAYDAVRFRRDFAFCLYPEEQLRAFCQQVL